jgi:hypothetical protein
MTKKVRWTCSEDGHPGILAPSRLRKVDVRRYCWRCSEAAGVLVERTAPAVERAATARSAKLAVKRARKARTVRERERGNRDARLANYGRYCGPAVVAKVLGVTRERAAALLAAQMGSDRHNRRTPSSVLRNVLLPRFLPGGLRWISPEGTRPTLTQWRKAHPKATAVVMVTGHYVYISSGRLIEHNGRKSSRARVRAWLDLSEGRVPR